MMILASIRQEAALKCEQQQKEKMRNAMEAVNSSGEEISLPRIAKMAHISKGTLVRWLGRHTDVARELHNFRSNRLKKSQIA